MNAQFSKWPSLGGGKTSFEPKKKASTDADDRSSSRNPRGALTPRLSGVTFVAYGDVQMFVPYGSNVICIDIRTILLSETWTNLVILSGEG